MSLGFLVPSTAWLEKGGYWRCFEPLGKTSTWSSLSSEGSASSLVCWPVCEPPRGQQSFPQTWTPCRGLQSLLLSRQASEGPVGSDALTGATDEFADVVFALTLKPAHPKVPGNFPPTAVLAALPAVSCGASIPLFLLWRKCSPTRIETLVVQRESCRGHSCFFSQTESLQVSSAHFAELQFRY